MGKFVLVDLRMTWVPSIATVLIGTLNSQGNQVSKLTLDEEVGRRPIGKGGGLPLAARFPHPGVLGVQGGVHGEAVVQIIARIRHFGARLLLVTPGFFRVAMELKEWPTLQWKNPMK